MKKLLSFCCSVLFMHSISYSSPDLKAVTQKLSGEKTIVKALTALVNREGKKKTPIKRVKVFFSEEA